MALCHNCNDTKTEYIGNGSQKDYTFGFEYFERGDIEVANWNEEFYVWEKVPNDDWVFLNDTEIRFNEAPENDQQFIIYRCTDLTPLPAEFYPGTAIKAQDLNDNFFVLKSAIEEARCETNRLGELAEEKYWNKVPYKDITQMPEPDVGETIYSTDRWVCTDDAIASTEAICDYVEGEIDILKVTKRDQQQGRWQQDVIPVDDDDHFATTAAISERLDPYFRSTKPAGLQDYEIPGKLWFNNDTVTSRYWDQENRVWIRNGLGGPPGPQGADGTYRTLVSDNPPTRRADNTSLLNGDVWFNSTNAQMFVWYDDKNPNNARGKQWVQAIGGAGPQGPEGPPGQSSYNFIQPIAQDGNDVSFDINLLQPLP